MIAHGSAPHSLLHWLGQYHFLFLHFPLACTSLAVLAECLFLWRKNPSYRFTAQFLLAANVLFALLTAATGLSLAEAMEIPAWGTLWWHRTFGLATLVLSVAAPLLVNYSIFYYRVCLALLFVSAFLTGELGGAMTFPHFRWLP
jgi:uncharacterized membrane protein